jgi:hypothetical protein
MNPHVPLPHLTPTIPAPRVPRAQHAGFSARKFAQFRTGYPQSSETAPLYLVPFSLDTTGCPEQNLACPREFCRLGGSRRLLFVTIPWSRAGGLWGKHHAISARLDCAVYQSAVRRSRPLAPRASLRPQCRTRTLPQLWRSLASRAAAHRAGPALASQIACRAPATAPSPPLSAFLI